MKVYLLFFFLVLGLIAKADAWDDLTKKEAEEVVSYIEKNPFIFDYCDCCSDSEYPTETLLLKVTSMEIIACEWKPEAFSIKYESEVVAVLTYNKMSITPAIGMDEAERDNTIYMNYTWIWNPTQKNASPIFDVIEYSSYGGDHNPCNPYFDYPPHSVIKSVNKGSAYKAYKKWYKKAMK